MLITICDLKGHCHGDFAEWLEGHTIDFENVRVIDRGNSRVRKTLESWHIAITSQAKHLPRQYSILL